MPPRTSAPVAILLTPHPPLRGTFSLKGRRKACHPGPKTDPGKLLGHVPKALGDSLVRRLGGDFGLYAFDCRSLKSILRCRADWGNAWLPRSLGSRRPNVRWTPCATRCWASHRPIRLSTWRRQTKGGWREPQHDRAASSI